MQTTVTEIIKAANLPRGEIAGSGAFINHRPTSDCKSHSNYLHLRDAFALHALNSRYLSQNPYSTWIDNDKVSQRLSRARFVDSELSLCGEIGGVTVTGRADNAWVEHHDFPLIVETKFRQVDYVYLSDQMQLSLYALLYTQTFKGRVPPSGFVRLARTDQAPAPIYEVPLWRPKQLTSLVNLLKPSLESGCYD
jgi:hypothetical protein